MRVEEKTGKIGQCVSAVQSLRNVSYISSCSGDLFCLYYQTSTKSNTKTVVTAGNHI